MSIQTSPIQSKEFPSTRNAQIEILGWLAEYFALTVKDIVRLRGQDPEDDNSRRCVQQSINRLLTKSKLHRVPYVDERVKTPTRSFVYGLNDSGVDEYGGKSLDDHSARTIEHELHISHFHILLKKSFPEPRFIITWQQSDLDHGGVDPDAHFSITHTNLPPDKNTFHFFLEMERAKIGNVKGDEPSIIRRQARYFELYNTDRCVKEWGFKQFRVLTVQRTAEKMKNLCARMATVPAHTSTCEIHQYQKKCNCKKLLLNHRMFYMTTEELFQTQFANKIYRTSKDFTTASYPLLEI